MLPMAPPLRHGRMVKSWQATMDAGGRILLRSALRNHLIRAAAQDLGKAHLGAKIEAAKLIAQQRNIAVEQAAISVCLPMPIVA
jgi:hypothetical protein